jgi:AcrR family transcriptional regulator
MNKKQNLIDAAIRLFADQGFEGTSTIQLSRAAGVTEPLIYYHFEGKNDLLSHVLKLIFNKYFKYLDEVDLSSGTEFEKIQRLIHFHLEMVQKSPREIYLITNGCPVKFTDPENICKKSLAKQREMLTEILGGCLEKGVATGEFKGIPVELTVELILAFIVGLIRQRNLYPENVPAIRDAAIEFCRRSLLADV